MNPIRLELTYRLVQDLGILQHPGVEVRTPEVLPGAALHLVHQPEFVEAVQHISDNPQDVRLDHGLGTEDTPGFTGMHRAAARLVGGTVECARAIVSGKVRKAVNFSGGMHHAQWDKAAGFCVYNDLAMAAKYFLAHGYRRVAILDLDGHHGDGTENIFADDPRVLTISVHETGDTLYPHSGYPHDIGSKAGLGSVVNVALPPGTSDRGWLRAIDAVVPTVLQEFHPDVLISQHGADSHREDPQTHLEVSINAQVEAMHMVRKYADRFSEGKWIATGGGGYEIFDVVPRSWAQLTAVVCGVEVAPASEVPAAWKMYVQQAYGYIPPRTMGDGENRPWIPWRENGFQSVDPIDRAVMATRKAVFPLFGLDPWVD